MAPTANISMACAICLSDGVSLVRCQFCNQECCNDCLRATINKCCFCGISIGEVDREVHQQIMLLAATKAELVPNQIESVIKQCPLCGVSVEREHGLCWQMYCTICGTVWLWNTLEIITDKARVHTPSYFIHRTRTIGTTSRFIFKSLVALDDEEHKYAEDSFITRTAFLDNRINFDEFCSIIKARYQTFINHINIREILEKLTENVISITLCNEMLSKYNASIDNLPYV